MLRAEGPARLLAAATRIGVAQGVGALSINAIAESAGVSKALVLYHFTDKTTLLRALHAALTDESIARLRAAAESADPLAAWRALVVDETTRGELALLGALGMEADVRSVEESDTRDGRAAAATQVATAIFATFDLQPRVTPSLAGRALLRHLDGLALTRGARLDRASIEAETDAFALALLSLGD